MRQKGESMLNEMEVLDQALDYIGGNGLKEAEIDFSLACFFGDAGDIHAGPQDDFYSGEFFFGVMGDGDSCLIDCFAEPQVGDNELVDVFVNKFNGFIEGCGGIDLEA